jgi:DNA-directed RNA polymerase subunit alpha
VERDAGVSTDNYGRFYIEPFERGFGTTIGNSLRRILLSSLEGSAVSSVKIAGVDHEFSAIQGVMEDVTDIVLNVKGLIVRLNADEPKSMKVSAKKAGVVTADKIVADPAIEIVNTDKVLATLTEDVSLKMEMIVENGRGYVSAAERTAAVERFDQEIGLIMIDSVFSPVTRVRYSTEETRVGQRTNYDRLILEIWTNGTVSPEMALVEAAKILRKHINPFVQYIDLGSENVGDVVRIEDRKELTEDEKQAVLIAKLRSPIEELDLSVRASNCLESANVKTIGQLVKMTENELMDVPGFGKTTLLEVQGKIEELDLELGMTDVDRLLALEIDIDMELLQQEQAGEAGEKAEEKEEGKQEEGKQEEGEKEEGEKEEETGAKSKKSKKSKKSEAGESEGEVAEGVGAKKAGGKK